MPVVVEDGTGTNPVANSYVTEAEAIAFATARDATFPSTEDEVTPLLINAMDYLESVRSRYQGFKLLATQPLAWPRKCVRIDCEPFPDGVIPQALKNAQMQLAIDVLELGDLQPTGDGSFAVASEKVDVLQVTYAVSGQVTGSVEAELPSLTKAQNWLDVVFFPCGRPKYLTTQRI